MAKIKTITELPDYMLDEVRQIQRNLLSPQTAMLVLGRGKKVYIEQSPDSIQARIIERRGALKKKESKRKSKTKAIA